uniref:cytochrome b n=1 Tax=Theileria luwenshuni TaxID=540482 RepID=UPI0022FD4D55|nr:cytochrome b [Theileria luwenshuni]WAS35318.1 cytochrome b [Theileria luwenshuni]
MKELDRYETFYKKVILAILGYWAITFNLTFSMNFVKSNLGTYQVSKTLNMNWNFGFILGMLLTFQILSGFLLTFVFLPSKLNAFGCLNTVAVEGNVGWFIRLYHSLGVSAYFLVMFFHIIKAIWYSGKYLIWTWSTGIVLLLTSIAVAFMGYILPDGQMSFWGATVIANLLGFLGDGKILVFGDFMVGEKTLQRFYTLHVLLPLVIYGIVVLHIYYLHRDGSSGPMTLDEIYQKTWFPDAGLPGDTKLMIMVLCSISIQLSYGILLVFQSDTDNSILANDLSTPLHIVPEWYLLLFYSTLKVFPTKVTGLLAILMLIQLFVSFSESRTFSNVISVVFYHRLWTVAIVTLVPLLFIIGCIGKMVVTIAVGYVCYCALSMAATFIRKSLDEVAARINMDLYIYRV